jgi:hypothetical protein
MLAVITTSAWAQTVAIQGTPWQRHTIDATSQGADGARLFDANGDDRPDIATAWEQGGVIRIYLHPEQEKVRAPWPVVTVGTVTSPEDAVLVDLDHDGAADVISSTEGDDRTVYLHWAPTDKSRYGDPSAWTTTPLPASQGRQWMFAAPFPIDARHGPDFVAAGKNKDASIGWFEAPSNPRDANHWVWNQLQPAGWIMSIVPIDMDGDTDLDIVYSDRRGPDQGVWCLENPGAALARLPWNRHLIGARHREVMFLDTGNLMNPKDLNVVAATLDGGILWFEKTTDAEWQQHEIPMPENTGTGKAVSIGDIDKDGRNDLVVSCENAERKHGVFRLSRNAKDEWEAFAISGLEGTKFDLVPLLDIDGDGDLDVITTEERENLGLIWYENPDIH